MNDGFRVRSGHLSDDLIVHIMMQCSTEYGQLRTYSANKNGDPKTVFLSSICHGLY